VIYWETLSKLTPRNTEATWLYNIKLDIEAMASKIVN